MIKPYMAMAIQAGWCNVENRMGIKDRRYLQKHAIRYFFTKKNDDRPQ